MRKFVVGFMCLLVLAGPLAAQQRRVFNNGRVDFAPSAARFVLSVDEAGPSLREIRYNINNGDDQVYEGPIQLSEEGRHVIRYRAVDVTGNVSAEKVYTVIIDDTPPELSATARGHAFVEEEAVYLRGDTAIILSAQDNASGVQGIYVSLDGRSFLRYTDAAYINEEGEHTGYAYVVDNVGNRSPTFRIRGVVDNTPPTVRIVPSTPLTVVQGDRYSNAANRFIVNATDTRSGVESVEVSINRQEFVTYTGPITFQDSGFKSIRARATDRLGNISPIAELTFFVDQSTPEPRIQAIID